MPWKEISCLNLFLCFNVEKFGKINLCHVCFNEISIFNFGIIFRILSTSAERSGISHFDIEVGVQLKRSFEKAEPDYFQSKFFEF